MADNYIEGSVGYAEMGVILDMRESQMNVILDRYRLPMAPEVQNPGRGLARAFSYRDALAFAVVVFCHRRIGMAWANSVDLVEALMQPLRHLDIHPFDRYVRGHDESKPNWIILGFKNKGAYSVLAHPRLIQPLNDFPNDPSYSGSVRINIGPILDRVNRAFMREWESHG